MNALTYVPACWGISPHGMPSHLSTPHFEVFLPPAATHEGQTRVAPRTQPLIQRSFPFIVILGRPWTPARNTDWVDRLLSGSRNRGNAWYLSANCRLFAKLFRRSAMDRSDSNRGEALLSVR